MSDKAVGGFLIKPWTAEQLAKLIPIFKQLLAKQGKQLGMEIFLQASAIITISLNIEPDIVKKWEAVEVGTVLNKIFAVNSRHFQNFGISSN